MCKLIHWKYSTILYFCPDSVAVQILPSAGSDDGWLYALLCSNDSESRKHIVNNMLQRIAHPRRNEWFTEKIQLLYSIYPQQKYSPFLCLKVDINITLWLLKLAFVKV